MIFPVTKSCSIQQEQENKHTKSPKPENNKLRQNGNKSQNPPNLKAYPEIKDHNFENSSMAFLHSLSQNKSNDPK